MRRRFWAGRAAAPVMVIAFTAAALADGPCERTRLFLGHGFTGDEFGQAVVVSADDLFIGAPGRDGIGWDGAVYWYTRLDTWEWLPRGGIRPALAEAEVGSAVAAAGDTLILGSPKTNTVHILQLQGGGWTDVQTLEPIDADSDAEFGRAVALRDDLLVVTSPFDQRLAAGALYLYERDAGGHWTLHSKLLGEYRLGLNLAMSGRLIAASTRRAVQVFAEQDDGAWLASGTIDLDYLASSGAPLAVHDERILIGEPNADYLVLKGGAVYVYGRVDGAAWELLQSLGTPRWRPGDRLGSSLGVEGEFLLAASRGGSDDDHFAAVHAYQWVNGEYTLRTQITLENISDALSPSLSLRDGAGYLGAPEADGDAPRSGVVDIFAWSRRDANGDMIPDACLVPGDINADGTVDQLDVQLLLDDYERECVPGGCVPIPLIPDDNWRECFGCELAVSAEAVGVLELWWDNHSLILGRHHIFERAGHDWTHMATFGQGWSAGWNVATNGSLYVAAGIVEVTHILERIGDGWFATGSIQIPDYDVHFATTIAGDTIAALRDDGVVVFYERIDGVWRQVQSLDLQTNIGYRAKAAGDQNLLCFIETYPDNVFILERGADRFWRVTYQARVGAGWLGSVTVDGERIVIGAPRDDSNPPNRGAAYVLERSRSGGWSVSDRLELPGNVQNLGFAHGVALWRDRLAVGAPFAGDGIVYLYERDEASGWFLVDQIEAPQWRDTRWFGASLALEDRTLAVGPGTIWEFYGMPDGNSFVLHLPFDDAGVYDPSLCPCPADVNNDAVVDQADLGMLLAHYGWSAD